MKRIEVLDLDKTAKDICDLYQSEGVEKISLNLVRELLDIWAVEKYPIFEKFGKKLMIESEEETSSTLDIEKSFFDSCETYANKHFVKTLGEDPITEPEQRKRQQHSVIGGIFGGMKYIYSSMIENVLENKAMKSEQELRQFLTSVSRYQNITPTPENYEKAMKQSKLTRQIYFMVEGTGGLCHLPDWYSKEDQMKRAQEHKSYIEMFPEAFNIALSEVKQNLITGPQSNRFVMSIHPYDFVTMSYNSIGWRSCVHPSGEYAKTAFSVMTDKTTFISYIPTSKFTSNGLAAFINNKKFRALSHFVLDYSSILLNKVYPSDFRSFSKVAEQAVSHLNLLGEEAKIAEYNTPYSDFSGYGNGSMYNDLDRDSADLIRPLSHYLVEATKPDVEIGRDIPCMSCGALGEYEDSESDWMCKPCRYGEGYGFCESCNEYRPAEYMGKGIDEYHCIECAESCDLSYCSCDHCVKRRAEEEEEEVEENDSTPCSYPLRCPCPDCNPETLYVDPKLPPLPKKIESKWGVKWGDGQVGVVTGDVGNPCAEILPSCNGFKELRECMSQIFIADVSQEGLDKIKEDLNILLKGGN